MNFSEFSEHFYFFDENNNILFIYLFLTFDPMELLGLFLVSYKYGQNIFNPDKTSYKNRASCSLRVGTIHATILQLTIIRSDNSNSFRIIRGIQINNHTNSCNVKIEHNELILPNDLIITG